MERTRSRGPSKNGTTNTKQDNEFYIESVNSSDQEQSVMMSDSPRSVDTPNSTPGSLGPDSSPKMMGGGSTSLKRRGSKWESRAQELREEINRESQSLRQLEEMAQHMPGLKRHSLAIASREYADSGYSSASTDSSRHSGIGRYTGAGAARPGNWVTNGRNSSFISRTDGAGALSDMRSTSQVIETLQANSDALKRDLRSQRELAKQEHASREALKKRCDELESTGDVLKQQIDVLSRMLDRKERKGDELERAITSRDARIQQLEVEARDHQSCSLRRQHLEEEVARLEAAYSAVLESARRVKDKCSSDIGAIASKIERIERERGEDMEKAGKLATTVAQQKLEREKLLRIQSQASELRQKHLRELESAFTDMKEHISQSDSDVSRKVQSALRAIDQMERDTAELNRARDDLEDFPLVAPLNTSKANGKKHLPNKPLRSVGQMAGPKLLETVALD